MTRYQLLFATCVLSTLTACSSLASLKARLINSPVPPVATVENPADKLTVQTIPFLVGTSSTTVEKLAKQNSCDSEKGAGLLTPPGTVEIYRIACDDGRIVVARCEMRQCNLTSISNKQ
jgi:hypothetical protein